MVKQANLAYRRLYRQVTFGYISSPDEFLVITPSAFAVAVNKQDQQNVYLFAFTRSDDVDDLALRVDKENVFWLEVGV